MIKSQFLQIVLGVQERFWSTQIHKGSPERRDVGTKTWGLLCGFIITVLKRVAGQDHTGEPGRRWMDLELRLQV